VDEQNVDLCLSVPFTVDACHAGVKFLGFQFYFFKNPLYQGKILDFHRVVFGWYHVEVVKITTLRSTFILLSSRSACEVVVMDRTYCAPLWTCCC
jgi:hypothetical protein